VIIHVLFVLEKKRCRGKDISNSTNATTYLQKYPSLDKTRDKQSPQYHLLVDLVLPVVREFQISTFTFLRSILKTSRLCRLQKLRLKVCGNSSTFAPTLTTKLWADSISCCRSCNLSESFRAAPKYICRLQSQMVKNELLSSTRLTRLDTMPDVKRVGSFWEIMLKRSIFLNLFSEVGFLKMFT